MAVSDTDRKFSGAIPQLYERLLVPLLFKPYAADVASRVARRRPASVLEIAAGTGVVTRQLADVLAADVAIVATDLNPGMLEQAAATGTRRPVRWSVADALQLPFEDERFDVVACQFGAMFFPDKPRAFAQVRRVLRRGGAFIFNVWDDITHNEFAQTVTVAMAGLFPTDPPRFLARIPHGYSDARAIAGDLLAGGFGREPEAITVTARSRASSASVPAIAYCEGTPLRNEIEARNAARLAEATEAAAAALRERFGDREVDGKIQAKIFVVER